VAKRRVGRYSNEFRRMCVERMKQCDDIMALSKELDVHSFKVEWRTLNEDTGDTVGEEWRG
jgi:transposase-like protein